jgi:hypothetical protein
MRSRLQLPIAPGKKLAALVCLLAVILLWSPLWATAWQAHGMACCNDGLCLAHGKPTLPPVKAQTRSGECEHADSPQRTEAITCSISCCHETPSSFTNAILFLIPQPAALSQPAQSVAAVSVLALSEFCQSLEPLPPPPRAPFCSL